MKRPLRPATTECGAAEFHLRQPKNWLRVQGLKKGKVMICATADDLAFEQKEAFVRYLRLEGFVSGDCELPSLFHERACDQAGQSVRWVVDPMYALHIQRLCWWTAGAMMAWLTLPDVLVCF